MAHQYKRHYSALHIMKALCGAGNHPMLAQGYDKVGQVTCKNCQRSLVANTGMVKIENERLVKIDA